MEPIELWYSTLLLGIWFEEKITLEAELRRRLPNVDADQRYATIYFTTFYTED